MKRSKKKQSTTKRTYHVHDHNSFLIIVGGGFIVILMVLFFLGMFTGPKIQSPNVQGSATSTNPHEVVIGEGVIVPNVLKARVGADIVFFNKGEEIRSISFENGEFFSGDILPGNNVSLRLDEAGTYTYQDLYNEDVSGVIIVE